MIWTSIIILSIYGILIAALSFGCYKLKGFTASADIPKTKFSVIVPFRNEENNLTELLNSLSLLNYPKESFEILMVNDDSEDDSINIIEHFKSRHPNLPIKILENQRKSTSPKKDAIETAINRSQFDWIITTDADCIVSKNWLQIFDAFIQTNDSKLIVAPVSYSVENSFVEEFQFFDFLSLQAATMGGFGLKKPFLCNGANLCYEKMAFFEVNGYEGNKQIASGDDIFLLEKINIKHPQKVYFLKSKEALVYTKPKPTFAGLISQRVRWAAKTSSVKNGFAKLVGIVVLLMNFSVISTFALFLTSHVTWLFLIFFITAKMTFDLLLLLTYFRFFEHKFHFEKYMLSSLCYPFFSVIVVVLSFKNGYQWKNRTFKK